MSEARAHQKNGKSLKVRAALVIGGLLVGYLVFFAAMTSRQLYATFETLQESLLKEQIERFMVQLAHIAESKALLIREYAEWDETYEFMGGGDSSYLASYYTPGSNTTGEDVVLFFDTNRKLVATRWLKRKDNLDASLSLENVKLIDGLLRDSKALGGVVEDGQVLLLASGPVLHNDQSGPARGWLVYGRWMNIEWLNETFDLIGMHVNSISAGPLPVANSPGVNVSPIAMAGIVPLYAIKNAGPTQYKATVFLPLLGKSDAAHVDVKIPMQVLEAALETRERIFLWGAVAGLCLLGLLAIAIRILFRENRLRLKAEEAERLREKSESDHLRRMTGMLPGIMYECEFAPDGGVEITFMNEAVREIFGLEPARLRANAREFSEHIHPDDRERIRAKIREHLETLEPWAEEYRYIFPNLGTRWVQSQGTLTRRESDGYIVWNAFITDITERKLQEEASFESEARFRSLMENPSVGIVITDVRLKQTHSNKAMAELLGYTEEEFPKVLQMDVTLAEDAGRFRQIFAKLLSGELPFYQGERRYVRKDGSIVWTLLNAALIRDKAGTPKYLISQVIDLSDLKDIENALREAKAEADRANQAKSEFLAMMSHEIRTPLHGVIGFASLLKDPKSPAEQQEIADSIEQSGRMLLALVTDVLDLSRIEAGRLTLDIRPTEIRKHLESISRAAELEARQKGLEFRSAIDASVPERLLADSLRINQILGNLLGNAFKFTQNGSVELSARAEPAGIPGTLRVIFSVSDTGIGIALGHRERLFQPFSQIDSASPQRKGTGLGLVIVRRLCELMGGGISLESEEGRGSVFTASIVVSECGASGGRKQSESELEGDLLDRARRLRYLVADDNVMNQKLIERLLSRIGCTAEIVSDGARCVEAAESSQPQIIFMDIGMPELDGLCAARAIRAAEQRLGHKRSIIIALTADVSGKNRGDCLEAGMDLFLGKPFNAEGLNRILSQALELERLK
jgi:PAS domain S-box-containing protein